jgi:Ca2+-binding RTX toxin-like protein
VSPGKFDLIGAGLPGGGGPDPEKFTEIFIVSYSATGSQLDALGEDETFKQTFNLQITSTITGESVIQPFVFEFFGKNDPPIAKNDTNWVYDTYLPNPFMDIAYTVTNNDTDPDRNDKLRIVPRANLSFWVDKLTTNQTYLKYEPLPKAIFASDGGNTNGRLDSIGIKLGLPFKGLTTGESATIVVNYKITDDFGATSTAKYTVTVHGRPDETIRGTNEGDHIYGETDADRLYGLNGNDQIHPRQGNDVIVTGKGSDMIFFDSPLGKYNVDRITDFTNVKDNNDTIVLDHLFFQKLNNPGHPLNPHIFYIGTGAVESIDYILYNRTTGVLSYDSNGDAPGGSFPFAILTNHAALTSADFLVI